MNSKLVFSIGIDNDLDEKDHTGVYLRYHDPAADDATALITVELTSQQANEVLGAIGNATTPVLLCNAVREERRQAAHKADLATYDMAALNAENQKLANENAILATYIADKGDDVEDILANGVAAITAEAQTNDEIKEKPVRRSKECDPE